VCCEKSRSFAVLVLQLDLHFSVSCSRNKKIQGHLQNLQRERQLHTINHSQPTAILRSECTLYRVRCGKTPAEREGAPPHDVGGSSMAPLLTNAAESGEDGIGEWECEDEFVSDVTHGRISPSTAAEIQWRVQVINHSGTRLFCSLSAKGAAHVELNVTLYGRKGKHCPTEMRGWEFQTK
jgi:hypothetical protein